MKSVACGLLIPLLVVIYSVSSSEAQGCICTQQYDPVCGSNGRTFSNSCQLSCEQDRNPSLRLAYRGMCRQSGNNNNNGRPGRPNREQGCFCTFQYDPVCGTDGRTYGSSCQLGCQSGGAKVAYRGECRRGSGNVGSGITSF